VLIVPERVLVTGAQGFVGRHVVAEALRRRPDAEVVGVGRSPRRDDVFTYDLAWAGRRVPAPLPPAIRAAATDRRYTYERVDVRDAERLRDILRRHRAAVIVHAASALRDDPWDDLVRANVLGVVGMVDAVRRIEPMPRIVLVSSGSVYGAVAADRLPVDEDDPCDPIDAYGASKLGGEAFARVGAVAHGIPLVRARIFNVLGPGLQDRHLAAALAGQVAVMRTKAGVVQLRTGGLDTTRDFVDVRDASAALLTLSETAAVGPDAIVNVASGRETSVRAVHDELVRLGGLEGRVTTLEGTPRAVDVPRSVARVDRLRATGFEPTISLTESLRDMLAYADGLVAGDR
jgi:nucleoside-diphosphate-sugar epimerase